MFADNLKKYRKHAKLTQSELANKVSVSTSTIGMYECAKRAPDIETLVKLSTILNITVDDLLGCKYIGGSLPIPITLENHTKTTASLDTKIISKRKTMNKDEFITQADALFMDVSEDDRDQLYRALSEIYFDSKAKNKEKYNPKKNKEK
ncbi:MAG: helix-turn-helix domain-containing protein [Cellulosilyticaceae bacterium]